MALTLLKRSYEKYLDDTRQEYKNQSDVDQVPLSNYGATEFGVMPPDKFMRAPKSMHSVLLSSDRIRYLASISDEDQQMYRPFTDRS
jgi:hypothetical protein